MNKSRKVASRSHRQIGGRDLMEQVNADRIMDDGLNRSKKIEQRPGWL